MEKVIFRFSALLAFIALLLVNSPIGSLAGTQTGNSPAVKVGTKAPNFTLKDTNDTEHSLANFKGKFVVLEWVNFDCPFVRKHYDSGNMQSLQKDYTSKGAVWLSINSSAPGKQGHFTTTKVNQLIKEKDAAPTAYLQDTTGKVGRAYGAKATPTMFVISPQGIIVYAGAIDDTPGTDSSQVKAAKNYVKLALDETMAGKKVTCPKTQAYGCTIKYQ